MKQKYHPISKCRMCGNQNLVHVVDLGRQFLTGVFPKERNNTGVTEGPLELVKCHGDWPKVCGLLQLRHSYDPAEMYGNNYGYRSGLNGSMVDHLRAKVSSIMSLVSLNSGDLVIDIGSNDGTTLSMYPPELDLIGVDPVGEKYRQYYPDYVELIPQLFSSQLISSRYPERMAKVITSFSMFYDLEDPLSFARQVAGILDTKSGIWVFEQSYMPKMIEKVAFDTICHEHIEYYGLKQIDWMLGRCGLKIIDVEFNDVNGGSFSITACHEGASHNSNKSEISAALAYEAGLQLDKIETYIHFGKNIDKVRDQLKSFLKQAKRDGKAVAALGASTKGNVLLQYCGLNSEDIEFIGEVNSDKFGSYTPGSLIPILDEVDVLKNKPDYLLVLPWHFRENFLSNPRYKGKCLVFPLPDIEVVCV
ncbi:methyltransferase [Thalassospira xiamenensis]|nr:methyltransferase [Thalassospira xiamenensis]